MTSGTSFAGCVGIEFVIVLKRRYWRLYAPEI